MNAPRLLAFCLGAGLIAAPALAQQSPMVQCRIGAFVDVLPDFACVGFTKAAKKLRRDPNSTLDCAYEAAHYMHASLETRYNFCIAIYTVDHPP